VIISRWLQHCRAFPCGGRGTYSVWDDAITLVLGALSNIGALTTASIPESPPTVGARRAGLAHLEPQQCPGSGTCVLTMIADEFGGEIPVGPFALIGDDSIGRGIVETLSGHRSPAVLMKNHGVFTIGPSAKAAVKAAVMCEDVARTVHIARQIGQPLPIAQEDVDSLFERYQQVYGQR
jgi:hypothetical protein